MTEDVVELIQRFDDLPVTSVDLRESLLALLPTDDVRERCVRWTPASGEPHRYRFVDIEGDTVRVHEEWTGCTWREVGRERVVDLEMTLDGEEVFAGP